MATLEQAIALAVKAHWGQVDKNGQPYILHPLRVMFSLHGQAEQVVGVLHDVVEDSDTTYDDLRDMGYSQEIIKALDAVTRRDNETYEEFVSRSEENPISCRVKLADLEDNMDLKRLELFTDKDKERLARYHKAWLRLSKHC